MLKFLYILMFSGFTFAAVLIGGKSKSFNNIIGSNYVTENSIGHVNTCRDIFGKILTTNMIYTTDFIGFSKQYRENTATNVLIVYNIDSTQSLQLAEYASYLWGGCNLLGLNGINISYNGDTNSVDYNYYTYWNTNTNFFDTFVTTITNYLNLHTNINIIAISWDIPYKLIDGSGIIYHFYDTAYNTVQVSKPERIDIPKIFSFCARTIMDTSNLLYRTSSFFSTDTNIWFVIDDCQDTWYGSTFPLNDTITNNINKIYDTTDNIVVLTNKSIFFLRENGFWAGYNDDVLRNSYDLQPIKNSLCTSIESYSLKSYRLGGTGRVDQARLFDCFTSNCNNGVQYNKAYGAVYGYTDEPWAFPLWRNQIIINQLLDGASYVDIFYWAQDLDRNSHTHIVCGNPFLRLTPNFNEKK